MKTIRKKGEWPIHFACCLPADPKINGSWCKGHNPYIETGSAKDLARNLRKYL